ncbi:MAG: hypothetical protein IJR58_07740 [Lachnospiraceae bacterium]|nr:hypothetical protein [Lachnospiraceae bacterium]
MNKNSSKSESLFLIEMIVVIFFFAVCAVVCARLFVLSHRMKNESKALTRAVMEAQNAAELFYATGGDIETVYETLPEDAVLITAQDGDFLDGHITIYDGIVPLYELELHMYHPPGGAEAQNLPLEGKVAPKAPDEVSP